MICGTLENYIRSPNTRWGTWCKVLLILGLQIYAPNNFNDYHYHCYAARSQVMGGVSLKSTVHLWVLQDQPLHLVLGWKITSLLGAFQLHHHTFGPWEMFLLKHGVDTRRPLRWKWLPCCRRWKSVTTPGWLMFVVGGVQWGQLVTHLG